MKSSRFCDNFFGSLVVASDASPSSNMIYVFLATKFSFILTLSNKINSK